MDILRHGDQVEVVAPPELRERIAQRLAKAAKGYKAPPARRGRASASGAVKKP
jgi:hypothetical protein